MQFLVSYNWPQKAPDAESAAEKNALTLQKVMRKRGRLPILTVCVCDSGEFAEQVTEWFHGICLPCCKKGGAGQIADRAGKSFWGHMEKEGGVWKTASFILLFCAGEEVFYVWRGDMGLWMLHMEFGRVQVRGLTRQTEGVGYERAVLEENIGLILGAEEFYHSLPQSVIRSCLVPAKLDAQERVDRRLAEVGAEAGRRGAESTAAILVATGKDRKR